MSEMTERSYDEVLEHEVLKKWEGKLIAWMKLGNGRRGVICKVRKAINRLSTSELQERCQAQFLRNLIDGLRRQKVFSVSQSCLTLYLLWDHLKATPIQRA
jgi:hypothetical protein